MSIIREPFGTLDDGCKVDTFTIKNNSGAKLVLSTLGAGIVKILMPDKDGVLGDCVLGHNDPKLYAIPDNGYQGLTVGRVANRIGNGRFVLDGIEYNVPRNCNNCLCLHGAGRFSFNTWEVEGTTDNSVTFSFFSPDMEDGFPGNFTCKLTYTLTEENIVRLDYIASADTKTVANLTNHAYFNLACDNSKIHDHILMLNSDFYTETDESIIPTGNFKTVKDTPMDFTSAKKIGDGIDSDFEDIVAVGGYDHCFCLRNNKGEFALAARLEDEVSGRVLEVYTDMPGVQVYTCNGMPESQGKDGVNPGYRRGVALETQLYPDTPNKPDFPSCYIDENEPLVTTTEFRFSVDPRK